MTSNHLTSRCFVSFYWQPPRRDSRPQPRPLCPSSALSCHSSPGCPPEATVVRCSDSTWKMNLCHQDQAGPPSTGDSCPLPSDKFDESPSSSAGQTQIQRFEASAPPLGFRDTGQPQRNVSLMKDVTRLRLTDSAADAVCPSPLPVQSHPNPLCAGDERFKTTRFSINVNVLVVMSSN